MFRFFEKFISNVKPQQEVQLVYSDNPNGINMFQYHWDIMRKDHPFYCPQFCDIEQYVRDDPGKYHFIAGLGGNGEIEFLTVFSVVDTHRGYWFRRREILKIRLQTASVVGGTPLGIIDENRVSQLIDLLRQEANFDLLTLENLPIASSMYKWAVGKRWSAPFCHSKSGESRRLIKLPKSMDEYWEELGATTRKSAARYLKVFSKFEPTYKIFGGEDAIKIFLPEAASLSSRTYLAEIDCDLRNDESTKNWFRIWSESDRLRCYISFIGNEPCAFAWGDISAGVFYFRQTGYDANLAKSAAGTAIIFYVIEDLINDIKCHTFDFGVQDMEYKRRFSNHEVECAHIMQANWLKPRSIALVMVYIALDSFKNAITAGWGKFSNLQNSFRRNR